MICLKRNQRRPWITKISPLFVTQWTVIGFQSDPPLLALSSVMTASPCRNLPRPNGVLPINDHLIIEVTMINFSILASLCLFSVFLLMSLHLSYFLPSPPPISSKNLVSHLTEKISLTGWNFKFSFGNLFVLRVFDPHSFQIHIFNPLTSFEWAEAISSQR